MRHALLMILVTPASFAASATAAALAFALAWGRLEPVLLGVHGAIEWLVNARP